MMNTDCVNDNKYDIEALLKNDCPVEFPIQGWSMYPFLHDGDLVTIDPFIEQLPTTNDVILYRRANRLLVLHRVIKSTPEGIYCRGDNQIIDEGPIQRSQILGILRCYRRNNRTVYTSGVLYKSLSTIWRKTVKIHPYITKVHHLLQKNSRD